MTGGTGDHVVSEPDETIYQIASTEFNDTVRIVMQSRPAMSILVSDADDHYRGHALPFVEHLRSLGAHPSLVVIPNLKEAGIGAVYRLALSDYVDQVLDDKQLAPHDSESGMRGPIVSAMATGDGVAGMVLSAGSCEYAGRLICGDEWVDSLPYSGSQLLAWTDLPAGRYRVRVFARNRQGDQPVARTSRKITVG